ncbi:Bax inhibitor-1 family protein [Bacillus smithii]|nr:Bax inhibitor-1 family protein [Bacillus smithii]MED4883594.1 Bax inhibitor-1 family protein [Bacillus smithii]MED4928101.1 Bax inhibitor-1 family protein [Bacillus smithii]
MLVSSVIGSIVFSLYILFDVNQMKHRHITEEMVPALTLSLYLDFINLFIDILQFLGIWGRDD